MGFTGACDITVLTKTDRMLELGVEPILSPLQQQDNLFNGIQHVAGHA